MIELKVEKSHVDLNVEGSISVLAPEATVAFHALLDTVKTFGEDYENKFKYLVCQIMTGELEMKPDAEV